MSFWVSPIPYPRDRRRDKQLVEVPLQPGHVAELGDAQRRQAHGKVRRRQADRALIAPKGETAVLSRPCGFLPRVREQTIRGGAGAAETRRRERQAPPPARPKTSFGSVSGIRDASQGGLDPKGTHASQWGHPFEIASQNQIRIRVRLSAGRFARRTRACPSERWASVASTLGTFTHRQVAALQGLTSIGSPDRRRGQGERNERPK
jgi:hypothetical protein